MTGMGDLMKRTIVLLCLIAVFLSFFGCGHNGTRVDTSGFETAQDCSEQITSALSRDTLQYLSGDLMVISSTSDNGDVLSVDARVILPQSIPSVAEELCSATTNILEENDAFSSYKITISYYEESNADGTNGDSLVTWNTTDGNNGTFVDSANDVITPKNIDQLYEYYDGFGKE